MNINCETKPLRHYWSECVGAGRANEGLRASWQKQLKRAVRECGFKYIRFHGLFHDDMCVYRVIDGREVYNFQYIDDLFDSLLAVGIRPFVELSFMPSDMTDETRTLFWWKANVNPPSDWSKWVELVEKTICHFIARYGLAEVRKWYFEVWNEPNLHNAFWTGGKAKYFTMYKLTSRAIKAIDSGLRVGGPATSNFVPDDRFAGDTDDTSKHMTHRLKDLDDADWQPVWLREFLDFCEREKLPLDFVSAHPYPTDFALDGHGETTGRSRSVNSTREDLSLIRSIVDNSAFKGIEIHLTEWSSSPSPRDHSHDYAPAAAFIVKANIESSGCVDSLSYWTFTDIFEEGGAGNNAFHGGFGMINYQGILKPSYHAYRFLNALGDEEAARGDNYIVTRSGSDGRCVILAYNYASDSFNTAVPMTDSFDEAEAVAASGKKSRLRLDIEGFVPGRRFTAERVHSSSGCAMGLYKELGYPSAPGIYETEIMKKKSELPETEIICADENGRLNIDREMQPWEIMLIREIL